MNSEKGPQLIVAALGALLALIVTSLTVLKWIPFSEFIQLTFYFLAPVLVIGAIGFALLWFFLPHGIRTTFKRELGSFFFSPIAYVCAIVFCIVVSILSFTLGGFIEAGNASLVNTYFTFHPWIFIFIGPAIGMRLWAEEHRQGTIELLSTMPVALWHAIIGKFLAAAVVIFATLFCTFPAVLTVEVLGNPDWGPIWTGYLGSFFLGCTCLAITTLISAFTRSQVIAFLVSLLVCAMLMFVAIPPVADFFGRALPGLDSVVTSLGFWNHFEQMTKGIVSPTSLFYFLILISFCIYATGIILRVRRGGSMNFGPEDLTALGGIGIAAIIGLLGFGIATKLPGRLDTTEHKIYTLSKGSKSILRNLDADVKIKYFATDGRDAMNAQERSFSKTIEDKLIEYKQTADGRVIYEKFNPEPATTAYDLAEAAGLQPLQGQFGEIFMGIVVECLDKREVIPFIDPRREELLEYDLTTAVSRVHADEKAKLAIMGPMNIKGGFTGNPQAPPAQPWFFYQQLSRDFEVELLGSNPDSIDPEVGTLIVLHPYDINEIGEYAIDQFLLQGGKVIALVDPMFYSARALTPPQQQPNPFGGGPPPGQGGPLPSSDLKSLFAAWGVEFVASQVVADGSFKTQSGPDTSMLSYLSLNSEAMDTKDPVTSQLSDIRMPFPGGLKVETDEGTGFEVQSLIHSSKNTMLVNSYDAEPDNAAKLTTEFKPTGEEYDFAVRLQGNFKSAFPDGNPMDKEEEEAEEEAPAPGDEDSAEEKEEEEEEEEEEPAKEEIEEDSSHLKESTKPGMVVVISDVDFIFNMFAVEEINLGPMGRTYRLRNQNLAFFQSLTELMSGADELVSLRSRASTVRPFTLLNEMEIEARQSMQGQLDKLNEEHQKLQENLQKALEASGGDGGIITLDNDMLADLRKAEFEAGEQIRAAEKELKKRRDGFVVGLKAVNIAVMPFVILVLGVAVFISRSARMAAR